MDPIARYLSGLRLGEPQCHHDLTLFPLLTDTPSALRYVTLSEALASGTIIIGEVGEAGRVSQLRVENREDDRVLLLDGEEVVGGKQNRKEFEALLNEAVQFDVEKSPPDQKLANVIAQRRARWLLSRIDELF